MDGQRARRGWGFAAVLLLMVDVALDVAATDDCLSMIRTSLGLTGTEADLLATVPLVLAGSLMLLMGGTADRIGARRLALLAAALFAGSSLVTATAQGFAAALVGRAGSGLAVAAALPCVYALTDRGFPAAAGDRRRARLRTRAFAAVTAAFGVGLGAGALIGGLAVTLGSWRWTYGVEAALTSAAFIGLLTGWPPSPRQDGGRRADLPGSILLALGLACLIVALVEAPRGHACGLVAGAAAGAVLLLAALWLLERRRRGLRRSLVMDPELLTVPTFVWGAATAALMSVGCFGALLFVPAAAARQVPGATTAPLRAGLLLLALGLGMAVGALAAPRLPGRARRRALLVGLVAQPLAVALGAGFAGAPGALAICLAAYGIAWGAAFAVLAGAMTADVQAGLLGQAAGAQTAVRWLVAAVASALLLSLQGAVAAGSPGAGPGAVVPVALLTALMCALALPSGVALVRASGTSLTA